MKRLLIFLSKTEWIWKSLSISNGVLIFFFVNGLFKSGRNLMP
jgi:hypothetical protein